MWRGANLAAAMGFYNNNNNNNNHNHDSCKCGESPPYLHAGVAFPLELIDDEALAALVNLALPIFGVGRENLLELIRNLVFLGAGWRLELPPHAVLCAGLAASHGARDGVNFGGRSNIADSRRQEGAAAPLDGVDAVGAHLK